MMKKLFSSVLIGLILLIPGALIGAAEQKSVAVLPFVVHSAESLDYIKQGIWEMLASRLSSDGRLAVPSHDQIQDALGNFAGKELSQADVYELGKTMKTDYVVWGSITKIGNSLSIDGKLVDVAAYKSPVGIFVQSQNLDEVIPRISDFAQRINTHITGVTPEPQPAVAPPPEAPARVAAPPAGGDAREAAIIAGMRTSKKGTFTAAINPDFINAAQPLDRRGFWMSPTSPTEFRGMDIGDVNGDRLNEVVLIDNYNVYIHQKTDAGFKLLQKISGKRYDRYLAVDIADINRNGVNEIIVTCLRQTRLASFVIEFREGKFTPIASDLPWFLRVIGTSSDSARLLGQEISPEHPFDTPIHKIVWENDRYREGQRMKIPQGLSVYGLALDDLGLGSDEKIIAIDESDYLCIYEQTSKPLVKLAVFGGSKERLFKSDEVFGGSNVSIDLSSIQPSAYQDEGRDRYFINPRILIYDTNGDKKPEIILVKNLSSTGRILKNVKLFTSSEVYNLEWDGLGLIENWKTRKIKGYVADYQFKDIDNDGQNEIVLALVQSVGATIGQRSVIVAYKMSAQYAPPVQQ